MKSSALRRLKAARARRCVSSPLVSRRRTPLPRSNRVHLASLSIRCSLPAARGGPLYITWHRLDAPNLFWTRAQRNAASFQRGGVPPRRSSKVTSNVNEVAGWLTNVQRKQLPFATAGALTDTAFDVRKHVVEKTFPRDFGLRNKRFAGVALG